MFLLILFALGLEACEKEHGDVIRTAYHINVNGRVIDARTGQPIGFAEVSLLSSSTIPDPETYDNKKIAETIADSNGNFVFSLDHLSGFSYSCSAIANLYFDWEEYFSVDTSITIGYNVEVTKTPIAFLNLHTQNISPYDSLDLIEIGNVLILELQGMDVNDFRILEIEGDRDLIINWYVTKNNITNYYWDTLNCPSFDTTLYEILY